VKLIKATRREFSFLMDREEKLSLFKLLEMYPLIPAAYQRLSKSDDRLENQQLLEEALSEQRRENKKKIAALFTSGSAFREQEEGCIFTLRASRVDWLLQVLNDVNVGSWLILGSPEQPRKMATPLTPKTAPFFWASNLSGHFQFALIQAMSGEADGVKE
jgi:hypothetical protein